MLNDVQRVAIQRALNTLASKPDYHHPAALIARIAGQKAVAEVAKLKSEFVAANKAAKDHGGAMLSASAADYWQEAQAALAYGRMVMANPSRGREIALSKKCEDLLAGFDGRVPDSEKGKFVQYVDGDAGSWDDRWHATVDFFFPLLSSSFVTSVPIKNPQSEAQCIVLTGLLDVPSEADRARNVSRLSDVLDRLSEERTAAEHKLAARAVSQAVAARKEQEKTAKQKRHAELVAQGDQKATKRRRKRDYKPVLGLFAVPAKGGKS